MYSYRWNHVVCWLMMIAQVAALPPLHWQFHSAASTLVLVLISLTPVHSFSYLCRECTSSHLSHHSRTGWPLNIKPNKQEQLWPIILKNYCRDISTRVLNSNGNSKWNLSTSLECKWIYLCLMFIFDTSKVNRSLSGRVFKCWIFKTLFALWKWLQLSGCKI